jgi:hypothetical protein
MYSLNGIGTSLYGKSDINPQDGSYIATKWFIVFLLPIFPLGSYRVIRGKTETTFLLLPGAKTSYQMMKVDWNWKQIGLTYLVIYGFLVLVILLLVFFSLK